MCKRSDENIHKDVWESVRKYLQMKGKRMHGLDFIELLCLKLEALWTQDSIIFGYTPIFPKGWNQEEDQKCQKTPLSEWNPGLHNKKTNSHLAYLTSPPLVERLGETVKGQRKLDMYKYRHCSSNQHGRWPLESSMLSTWIGLLCELDMFNTFST